MLTISNLLRFDEFVYMDENEMRYMVKLAYGKLQNC